MEDMYLKSQPLLSHHFACVNKLQTANCTIDYLNSQGKKKSAYGRWPAGLAHL